MYSFVVWRAYTCACLCRSSHASFKRISGCSPFFLTVPEKVTPACTAAISLLLLLCTHLLIYVAQLLFAPCWRQLLSQLSSCACDAAGKCKTSWF
jgi:hypothetical protein